MGDGALLGVAVAALRHTVNGNAVSTVLTNVAANGIAKLLPRRGRLKLGRAFVGLLLRARPFTANPHSDFASYAAKCHLASPSASSAPMLGPRECQRPFQNRVEHQGSSPRAIPNRKRSKKKPRTSKLGQSNPRQPANKFPSATVSNSSLIEVARESHLY